MRKILFALIYQCVMLSAPLFSDELSISVVAPDYPPLVIVDSPSASPSGLSTKIVLETFRRAGMAQTISILPWARALEMAKTNPNCFIFPVIRTQERDSDFIWIGPVARFEYMIYSLKDTAKLPVKRIEDLDQASLGILNRDVLESFFQSKKFTRLTLAPSLEALTRLLFTKRIEYIATTKISLEYELKKAKKSTSDVEVVLPISGLAIDPYSYLAVSSKSDQKLIQRLRSAIESMKNDGTLERLLQSSYVP